MKINKLKLIILIALIFVYSLNAIALPCDSAQKDLADFAIKARIEPLALSDALQKQLSLIDTSISQSYCLGIIGNLLDKESSRQAGTDFSVDDIVKHVLEYERFRLESYISSGVSPKRFFGFFDEQGDTAKYESEMRIIISEAVSTINEYAQAKGFEARISDKEVAVTFLAEGGALLLTNRISEINNVHPVRDAGLDDFRSGFPRFPGLINALDRQFGTGISEVVWRILGTKVLLRPLTFEEVLVATSVMYLYEKDITITKYKNLTGKNLSDLDLDRQFIHSSLVFNSGLLFSEERVEQIIEFSTSEYLDFTNKKNSNTRPRLAIFSPAEIRQHVTNAAPIPQQLTSWNAVYHILQRYGAWKSLEKFSDTFDEKGFFRQRP